jgi:hypothetical protein
MPQKTVAIFNESCMWKHVFPSPDDTSSPRSSFGTPNTAASATLGCVISRFDHQHPQARPEPREKASIGIAIAQQRAPSCPRNKIRFRVY